MLILVRPSRTFMWTTSPIAAAAAVVGSSPGAGSRTMPRTTLSLRCCADAGGATARSAASRSAVADARIERCKGMAESPANEGAPTLRDRALRLLRALALDASGGALLGRRGLRDLAAAVRRRRARALQHRLHRRLDALAVGRLRVHRRVALLLQVAAQRHRDEPGVARVALAASQRVGDRERRPVLDSPGRETIVLHGQREQRELP